MLLKTRGRQSAAELAALVGVTPEAVRQQLVHLAAEGLTEAAAEPRGVGRPTQVWRLTARANDRFPDTHAELTVQLLSAVRAQLGEKALDRIIDARAAENLASYQAALDGAKSLGDRVTRLAAARTREGYMAEAHRDGEGFLLVENHCPICAAATECQGFCRAERDTFQKALGPGVFVERTEHIVSGDRRCAYRIALECVQDTPHTPTKRKRP
jgi:predicted ArsR family transcriptional regulator